MKILHALVTFCAMLAFAPIESLAQKAIPIYIESSVDTNDSTGTQVLFEIKEAIRRSAGFRLVDSQDEWPYIRHAIVFMAVGTQTIVSHSFIYDSKAMPLNGAFIYHSVQYCPRIDQAKACAARVMGSIDHASDELKRVSPALWKTLR